MEMRLNALPVMLDPGRLIALRTTLGGRIAVLKGKVWVTRERNGGDRILAAGDTLDIDELETVLVSGAEPSTVSIAEAVPTPCGALDGLLERVADGLWGLRLILRGLRHSPRKIVL